MCWRRCLYSRPRSAPRHHVQYGAPTGLPWPWCKILVRARRSPWLLPSVVHLIGPLPALYARAVPVDRQYPNLERLHASPDIYIIKDFLTDHECTELQAEASRRGLSQSPVKYGGWTQDVGEALRLLAVGPAVWIALLPELSSQGKPTAQIALEAVGTWLGSVALFGVLLLGWAKWREVKNVGQVVLCQTAC